MSRSLEMFIIPFSEFILDDPFLFCIAIIYSSFSKGKVIINSQNKSYRLKRKAIYRL